MSLINDDHGDGVNVLIDFTTKVNVVRMIGNVITPATLHIKTEVLPHMDAGDLDFDVAFSKIKFWFDTVVARTVIFSRNNTTALAMLTDEEGKTRVVNQLMITPHQPTDEHLGALFQSKMAALSNDMMHFGAVRVNSESPTGLIWTYVGNSEDDLPSMEEWFNEKPYYFDRPWWHRNDVSTIDMIPKGATDFSAPPPWAFDLDFIEAAIRPKAENTEPSEPLENVVIRGAFRPKVIDGESDE